MAPGVKTNDRALALPARKDINDRLLAIEHAPPYRRGERLATAVAATVVLSGMAFSPRKPAPSGSPGCTPASAASPRSRPSARGGISRRAHVGIHQPRQLEPAVEPLGSRSLPRQRWSTHDALRGHAPEQRGNLKDGASGAYNTYWKQFGHNAVKAGFSHVTLRIGWEMNGGWFKWSAAKDPNHWKAYWKQIVTTLRKVPGSALQLRVVARPREELDELRFVEGIPGKRLCHVHRRQRLRRLVRIVIGECGDALEEPRA